MRSSRAWWILVLIAVGGSLLLVSWQAVRMRAALQSSVSGSDWFGGIAHEIARLSEFDQELTNTARRAALHLPRPESERHERLAKAFRQSLDRLDRLSAEGGLESAVRRIRRASRERARMEEDAIAASLAGVPEQTLSILQSGSYVRAKVELSDGLRDLALGIADRVDQLAEGTRRYQNWFDASAIAIVVLLVVVAVSLVRLARFSAHLESAVGERTRELRRLNLELADANRTKTAFLANMSHELRTPLNAIIGFTDAMLHGLHGPLPERYAEYTAHIHAAGQHLLQLVKDLLDISRIEIGQIELNERPDVDLRALIREACAMATAGARHPTVTCREGPPLPDVRGDEHRLRQIFLNLIGNAVKFTPPEGAVEVRAWRRPDGGISAEVRDDGPGMPADQIEAALEPFRQLPSTGAQAHQGAGLGLPIAKALVELHGGRLQIESATGFGTAVIIHLPPERSGGGAPSAA